MAKKVAKKTDKDINDIEDKDDTLIVDQEEDTNDTVDSIPSVDIEQEVLVDVKVNGNLNSYIGDKYYHFMEGHMYKVPKNVKVILREAGYLDAI